jgi:hypothetical protein
MSGGGDWEQSTVITMGLPERCVRAPPLVVLKEMERIEGVALLDMSLIDKQLSAVL